MADDQTNEPETAGDDGHEEVKEDLEHDSTFRVGVLLLLSKILDNAKRVSLDVFRFPFQMSGYAVLGEIHCTSGSVNAGIYVASLIALNTNSRATAVLFLSLMSGRWPIVLLERLKCDCGCLSSQGLYEEVTVVRAVLCPRFFV